jgi:hypothetical protein
LKSFFEFIYDIYKLNFDFDISSELYDDFQFIYDGLRETMQSDGDEVELNATKKTYKLIKSTKRLLLDSKSVDGVIKLSIIVIRLIDKHVWNKEVKVYNPYLKRGYDEWTKALEKDNVSTRVLERAEFRSSWEAKYILNIKKILIVPSIHRVKAQYYRNITIIVNNGDEMLYENGTPDIREIIGGYQISVNGIQ